MSKYQKTPKTLLKKKNLQTFQISHDLKLAFKF